MNRETPGLAITPEVKGGPSGTTLVNTNPGRISAIIAHIQTELLGRGWTCIETSVPEHGPGMCHLICYQAQDPDGTRRGWGLFDRFYCWTQAFESITGQTWWHCVNGAQKAYYNPDNGGRRDKVRITVPGPFKGKGGFAAKNQKTKDDPNGFGLWDNGGLALDDEVKR